LSHHHFQLLSLGDIHVSTILTAVGGAIAILFGVVVLIWLLEFSELTADFTRYKLLKIERLWLYLTA